MAWDLPPLAVTGGVAIAANRNLLIESLEETAPGRLGGTNPGAMLYGTSVADRPLAILAPPSGLTVPLLGFAGGVPVWQEAPTGNVTAAEVAALIGGHAMQPDIHHQGVTLPPPATEAEAMAGTGTDPRLWSPLRVQQAVGQHGVAIYEGFGFPRNSLGKPNDLYARPSVGIYIKQSDNTWPGTASIETGLTSNNVEAIIAVHHRTLAPNATRLAPDVTFYNAGTRLTQGFKTYYVKRGGTSGAHTYEWETVWEANASGPSATLTTFRLGDTVYRVGLTDAERHNLGLIPDVEHKTSDMVATAQRGFVVVPNEDDGRFAQVDSPPDAASATYYRTVPYGTLGAGHGYSVIRLDLNEGDVRDYRMLFVEGTQSYTFDGSGFQLTLQDTTHRYYTRITRTPSGTGTAALQKLSVVGYKTHYRGETDAEQAQVDASDFDNIPAATETVQEALDWLDDNLGTGGSGIVVGALPTIEDAEASKFYRASGTAPVQYKSEGLTTIALMTAHNLGSVTGIGWAGKRGDLVLRTGGTIDPEPSHWRALTEYAQQDGHRLRFYVDEHDPYYNSSTNTSMVVTLRDITAGGVAANHTLSHVGPDEGGIILYRSSSSHGTPLIRAGHQYEVELRPSSEAAKIDLGVGTEFEHIPDKAALARNKHDAVEDAEGYTDQELDALEFIISLTDEGSDASGTGHWGMSATRKGTDVTYVFPSLDDVVTNLRKEGSALKWNELGDDGEEEITLTEGNPQAVTGIQYGGLDSGGRAHIDLARANATTGSFNLPIWMGSQAAYDALTPEANVLYFTS